MEDWIKNLIKKWKNALIIWKEMVLSLPLIGKWLVWEIGNKRKLGMGADPWVGSAEGFKLSHDMINYLHGKFSYLIR